MGQRWMKKNNKKRMMMIIQLVRNKESLKTEKDSQLCKDMIKRYAMFDNQILICLLTKFFNDLSFFLIEKLRGDKRM